MAITSTRTHKMITGISSIFLAVVFLAGCDTYFGDKTDTDFLEVPTEKRENVGYVPIQPPISGLDYPTDVIAGFDELIYVADSGAEKIKSYDVAGNFLGSFPVPGLTTIAQDRRLDLLAVGTFDTVINGQEYELSTIYRIDLIDNSVLSLENAKIVNKIVHPFYSQARSFNSGDTMVHFEDIGVLANHKFYVTRTGPGISSISPDNTVLLFNEKDRFETRICINTSTGKFCDYFKRPVGLSTRIKPPQRPTPSESGDFIFTSFSPDRSLKVQYISKIATPNGVSYELEQFPKDTSKADGFMYQPGRFVKPGDVTVAGDETNYIFVTDKAKDSVYQFTANGLEGVNPPPGSNADKNIRVSFGGTGSGPRTFNEPTGVAYKQERLYVADGKNGKVKRFKLTTDFD